MTLKERLVRYFRNKTGFVASGDIQRIASEKTSYTPSNVSRRLRELENEGVLEVRYIKGHAHYRHAAATTEHMIARGLEWFDQLSVR